MRALCIASFFVVLLGAFSCVGRAQDEQDYRACSHDDDCNDGATCARTAVVSVCRPTCDTDVDCPAVDGTPAYCLQTDDLGGQCVLPCESCPDGMTCIQATSAPSSGLVCVWAS